MSTGYDRPSRDDNAMPCGYTSYEPADETEGVTETEQSQTGGGVPATGAGQENVSKGWSQLLQ